MLAWCKLSVARAGWLLLRCAALFHADCDVPTALLRLPLAVDGVVIYLTDYQRSITERLAKARRRGCGAAPAADGWRS